MAGAYSKQIFLPKISSPTSVGFIMGKTIGEGTFSKIKAAWCPFNQEMIAIKIIKKSKNEQMARLDKFLIREMDILTRLDHPLILKTFTVMETSKGYFILQEIAENGDLLDYIHARCSLSEKEACFIFHQLCKAVGYCHGRGIAHRDLKCENVMLDRHMNVKLGDFGFAIDLNFDPASTRCGTKSYAAPEILNREITSYDPMKSDIWSLGVILHVMVCGFLPSKKENRDLTFRHHVTRPTREVIGHMLSVNLLERPSIMDLKKSLWLDSASMTRPTPLSFSPQYTVANCLPQPPQVRKTLPSLSAPSSHQQVHHASAETRGASSHAPQPPVSQPSPVSTASPVSRQPLAHLVVPYSQKHKTNSKVKKFPTSMQ